MKTPSNDGGSAFPLINDHTHPTTINNGMTLRDYFAGQALAGILVSPNLTHLSINDIADRAFLVAEAMLDERMEEAK